MDSYIDRTFYEEVFLGDPMPEREFIRLSEIASEVVYDLCIVTPNENDLISEDFKKAVAYQVELLSEQGGIDAILGFATNANTSEHLGDYSVTSGGGSSAGGLKTKDGIPVSSMAISILRRMGLMNRWAYAKR